MSEIKVNKISPRTACGTVTLGDSGDTFTIPSGATITNAGTATGFGRTGTVDWITTPKTATFTAASGSGYFVNTTGGIITVNLPAGAAGSIVSLADYAATWQTNNVTISPNGTDKIGGLNVNVTLSTEGQSVTLVYVDSTQGWVNTMDSTSNVRGATYIVATGGSVPAGTTCGNYKIHTFTGPGTLCVSQVSCSAANNVVSYVVAAGGGGGGSSWRSGGGGAGGFREYKNSCDPYTASPLDGNGTGGTAITVTASPYPITVGGGGAGGGPAAAVCGVVGQNSVFSTITSAGGGNGGKYYNPGTSPVTIGGDGGSGGGGGGGCGPGGAGTGDTPATTPAQGFPGGAVPGVAIDGGGGGGGATAVGTVSGADGPLGSAGGAGAGTLINPATGEAGPGPSQYYSGGGGGGQYVAAAGTSPAGGVGGGGDGGKVCGGVYSGQASGTANTGGGGGGKAGTCSTGLAGSGGSGIVIIRYKFQ